MNSLYDLTNELAALRDMMGDAVDMDVLFETMESIQMDFDDKIINYCKVDKELEAQEAGIKAELTRLKQKYAAVHNNRMSMRNWMYQCMKESGTERVKSDLFTVSIQKNGGKAPLIVPEDVQQIPKEFLLVEFKANSDRIRRALEEGREIPGCHFGERGESVRIR